MEGRWLVGLLPFQHVGQQNLVEAFGDVSRDEVNLVLSALDFQLLKVVTDGSFVVITNLVRVYFQLFAGLHIDKAVKPVFQREVELQFLVIGMEEYHLVLVMTQVLEGEKEFLGIPIRFEHITEDDDHRAAVDLFGDTVECVRHHRLPLDFRRNRTK